MIIPFDDTYFMKKALQEAQMAFDKDEIPVGAVIVFKDKIIARAHNLNRNAKRCNGTRRNAGVYGCCRFFRR